MLKRKEKYHPCNAVFDKVIPWRYVLCKLFHFAEERVTSGRSVRVLVGVSGYWGVWELFAGGSIWPV